MTYLYRVIMQQQVYVCVHMKVNAPCRKSKETKTEVLVSTAVAEYFGIKLVNETSSSFLGLYANAHINWPLAKLLFNF